MKRGTGGGPSLTSENRTYWVAGENTIALQALRPGGLVGLVGCNYSCGEPSIVLHGHSGAIVRPYVWEAVCPVRRSLKQRTQQHVRIRLQTQYYSQSSNAHAAESRDETGRRLLHNMFGSCLLSAEGSQLRSSTQVDTA